MFHYDRHAPAQYRDSNLHDPLPADKVTIGGYLKKASYYTASVEVALRNVLDQYDLVTDTRPAGSELWIDTLQKRPKDKPFFVTGFASYDAHRPCRRQKANIPLVNLYS